MPTKKTKETKETKLTNKLRKFTHNNTDKVQKCILSVFLFITVMANPIDLIITQEALKAIDTAIARVNTLDKELAQTAQNFIDNSKKMATASANITPSNVNNKANETAKLNAELDSLKTKYISLNDAINKQSQYLKILSQQQVAITKNTNNQSVATRQQAVSQQILRAETDRNIRATTNLGGAYAKASAQLLVLKKEAKDAAIAYGENSKKAQEATRAALDLDARIKAVDKSVGDSQRNVGNYSGGLSKAFSGLKFIANILPGIGIAGLLSFAVEPIIEWVSNLIKGAKAINSITESQKQLNQINIEGRKNAVEETLKVKSLLEVAKDTTLTYKERMIAVKELQNTYPAYFQNLSKEQILAGNTAKAEQSLTDAILSRAKAQAATAKITENQSQIIDLEEEKLKISKQLTHAELELASAKKLTGQVSGGTVAGTYDPEFIAINKVASARRSLQSVQEKINSLNEINNRLTSYSIEKQKESILLDYKEEKSKQTKTEKREDLEYFNSSIKARGTLNQEIDKSIDRLRTEAILNAGNIEHVDDINKLISQLLILRNKVNEIDPVDVNIVKNPEKVKTQLHEMSEELKNFTQSFQSEFFSNSGFSSLNTFITGEFDDILDSAETFTEKFAVYFNSIAEIAQDTFNFISEASTKNFDAEKERLQAQYDIALQYAGDNKAAQEKLADDLEKQKKETANRESKAKQKQTLFNIAIDTAQAVVSAVAQSPLTFGLPWSAFALALGATQAALVASQEIPRYWMGGTHDGGLMMVNDGKGSNYKETIVTPDGKVMKPQGRNVIMDAPAGTEIYTYEMWQDKLAEMLQGKGIDMAPVINNNSGLSKSDMYDVLMDTLGSQPQHYSNFDANGATEYIMKGGNKTILNRNRSNGKGQRFR